MDNHCMFAYIFDVDGVLTNPNDSEVIKPAVLVQLVQLLEQSIPLSFITGRGMIWLRENLITKLEKYVNKHPVLNKKILDLLYVSGEFGGVTAEHTNGIRQEFIKKEFVLPSDLKNNLIHEINKFRKFVFIENEKQTILTLRTYFNLTESESLHYKKELLNMLSSMLVKFPQFEVQSDRLSINIRFVKANKKIATDQFILWLHKKGIKPDMYYIFGDSPSDLEMGEDLISKNLPFEFIYLGKKKEIEELMVLFPISFTNKHYDEGLLEFLRLLRS